MTGAQTEPIRVSKFEQATALLLHIAHFLFYTAVYEHGTDETAFLSWCVLRLIAQRFLATRAAILTLDDRALLDGALRVAHDLTHPEGSGVPADCTCLMSITQRELWSVIAEAEMEAR